MPPKLINRADAQDQVRYWRNSHELDQVASWILATVWSGTNPQGWGAQGGQIGLRTVAVVCLDNQTLLVGSNALSLDDYAIPFNPNALKSTPNYHYKLEGYKKGDVVFEPQLAVRSALCDIYKAVEFPAECQNGFGFHAEMALLQYMAQKNMHLSPKYIGVSKPCCKLCHMILNGAGIDHSFYHKDAVGDWQEPSVQANWKA
jgi:hypothetical protein